MALSVFGYRLSIAQLMACLTYGAAPFAKLGEAPHVQTLKLGTGTIVDAAIAMARSSKKKAKGLRNLKMHQTRKGGVVNHGKTPHVGLSQTRYAHSAMFTAADVHHKHPLPNPCTAPTSRCTSIGSISRSMRVSNRSHITPRTVPNSGYMWAPD